MAKNHLKKRCIILIHFGTSGNLSYLKYFIRKNGFKRKQILKGSKKRMDLFYLQINSNGLLGSVNSGSVKLPSDLLLVNFRRRAGILD